MRRYEIISIVAIIGTLGLFASIDDSFSETDIPELITEYNLDRDIRETLVVNPFDFEINQAPATRVTESDLIVDTKSISLNLSALDNDKISIDLFGTTYIVTKDYINVKDEYFVWTADGGDTQAISVLLLVFDDGEVYGHIITSQGTFSIEPYASDSGEMVNHKLIEHALGKLPPPSHAQLQVEVADSAFTIPSSATTAASTSTSRTAAQENQIKLLYNSYNPSTSYSKNTVTIDVFIGYTTAVKDEDNGISRTLLKAIERANFANEASKLPVIFNLVESDDVRYTEKSTMSKDLAALNPDVDNDSAFNRLRADAANNDADILLLITNVGTTSSEITAYGGCGVAPGLLALSADRSIAVINYPCLASASITHEMGHLFGAGHNRDEGDFGNKNKYKNDFFPAGHGYYNVNAGARTVMSYDCDDDADGNKWTYDNSVTYRTCAVYDVWSDPTNDYQGTVTATGVFDTEHNASVIFGAAPYLASLRGETQSYDDQSPYASLYWLKTAFQQSETLPIKATFNEVLHGSYPPHVTISDGTTSTTAEMSKSTDTVYTASHDLSDEVGTVTLSFSNARDIYGNPVIAAATSGGSITVQAPDTTKPVITLSGSSMTLEVYSTFTDPGYSCTDAVDGTLTVTVGGDTVNTSSLKTYVITYDCTDTSGNDATQKTRTVTIQDVTDPVITELPPNIYFEATAINTPLTSTDYGLATASDNYDSTLTITNDADSTFPLGDTTITWTATDSSGNDASGTQIISIVDTTLPVLTVPPNDTFTNGPQYLDETDYGIATATDIFDVTIDSWCFRTTPCDDSFFSKGGYVIIWQATDTSGNSAIYFSLIHVKNPGMKSLDSSTIYNIQSASTDKCVKANTKLQSCNIKINTQFQITESGLLYSLKKDACLTQSTNTSGLGMAVVFKDCSTLTSDDTWSFTDPYAFHKTQIIFDKTNACLDYNTYIHSSGWEIANEVYLLECDDTPSQGWIIKNSY